MNLLSLFFLTFLLFSCSSAPLGTREDQQKRSFEREKEYSFSDLSGNYRLVEQIKFHSGLLKKRRLITDAERKSLLEKTVTAARKGALSTRKGQDPILLPLASQYSVWYQGQRYFTQLKLDRGNRAMDVMMESPDKNWNGTKTVKFPKGKVFCFFSQIAECLKATGFVRQASEFGGGTIPFHIIWENYPFHSEQYKNLKGSLFTPAVATYDNKVEQEHRFSVEFSGQVIFLLFSKRLSFQKLYWVAQGISMAPGSTTAGKETFVEKK